MIFEQFRRVREKLEEKEYGGRDSYKTIYICNQPEVPGIPGLLKSFRAGINKAKELGLTYPSEN